MPNLTSYHAPPIHLYRELPKTYCDLIRHEKDYHSFLSKRIANIQSNLSYTNKKSLKRIPKTQQHKCFDHNQRLFHIYNRNVELCQKILQIWAHQGKQQGGVDCHNENYRKQTKISHFRLRQKQWKVDVENENKRFIQSLVYHRNKYQPEYNRTKAYEDFQHHLKLLKSMSHYPKFEITNPIYKNLLDYKYLPEYVHYKYKNLYKLNANISLTAQCHNLPSLYKLNKTQKSKIKFNEVNRNNTIQATEYLEHFLRKTLNNAVYIYNQPLPSTFNYIKSSCSFDNQRERLYSDNNKEVFRSLSCSQLLEPWRTRNIH